MTPAVFVDLEASALHNGFPIEVGWARVDAAGDITVEAWLIKPPLAWAEAEWRWSFDAQRIHDIPLTMLMRDGRTCTWIAERMNTLFAGQTLYSDAPGFDARWLEQVFHEAGIPWTFSLADVALAFDKDTDEVAYERLHRTVFARRPHRAGPDARQWADLYQATRCHP